MPIERQMRHLNNEALCAIWIEVSGNNPRKHDIIEICIILLDNFIVPSKLIFPFYTQIQPFHDEIDYDTATRNKEAISQCKLYGLEPTLAADRLDDWVVTLDLPNGKKIVPVTHNWALKREYLHTWLGFHNFNTIFSDDCRDIQAIASYTNDCRNQRTLFCPYPKVIPEYLGCIHKIPFRKKMDVMEKALKISEIFKAMIANSPSDPNRFKEELTEEQIKEQLTDQ